MLSISSRDFVKRGDKQAKNEENSQNASPNKQESKLAYSTTTFKPNK